MNKRELWLRLKNYHFEHMASNSLGQHLQARFGGHDASTKAFAHKVARKYGWSPAFALKAVREYKKFVYLGVVSDFVVTPSQVIDQVWHQHILFSKAYRSFCQEIIRYEFDHNPELVSIEEQTGAFHAQYLATLKLYRTEFGIDPPADVWGAPKFDEGAGLGTAYPSKKKEKVFVGGDVSYSSDPLYRSFDPVTDGSFIGFLGFGSGDGGASGAGGDWGDGDSGDAGGDSGSCSSCSSGCGGD